MLCRRIFFSAKNITFACGASKQHGTSTALDFDMMPSHKGLPIIGNTLSLIAAGGAKNLHKFMDRRHQKLGPIFKDNVGPVTAVFLSDPLEMKTVFANEGKCPVHIKPESWLIYNEKNGCSRGLFFMDGEEWLHCRKIMNKLLLRGPQPWIGDCCDGASDLLLDKISQHEGQEFSNIEAALYKWSVDIIVSVLLGSKKYKDIHRDLEPLTNKLASTVNAIFETTGKLQLVPAKFAEKYNIGRWRRFEKSVDLALSAASDTLNELKKNAENQTGLLYKMQQEDLTEKQIDTIILDLLLGASDTTANAFTWMLYLLSKNKNIQSKLRHEIKTNPNTTYVEQVTREVLRLYPPAPFLTRFIPEAAVVCGYTIPANTLIVMSIYSSGRDERHFKNPHNFLPERWDRNSPYRTSVQPLGSLPFAMGARACIGKKIADAQLHTTLSKVVDNYDIHICNKSNVNDILAMITKPSESIRLIFNKI